MAECVDTPAIVASCSAEDPPVCVNATIAYTGALTADCTNVSGYMCVCGWACAYVK